MTDRQSRIAAKRHRDREAYVSGLRDALARQVPDEYRGRSIKGFAEDRWGGVISRSDGLAMSRYLRNPTRFLVLVGPTGTGKSTAAFSVADYLVAATGTAAKFASATRMMSDFSFGVGERSAADLLREHSDTPILIIDDLGSANDGLSAHQQRSLWSLIDARWSNRLYTIITTNMSITGNREGSGLTDILGTSAWDRVSDSMTLVNFNGESFRGRK